MATANLDFTGIRQPLVENAKEPEFESAEERTPELDVGSSTYAYARDVLLASIRGIG